MAKPFLTWPFSDGNQIVRFSFWNQFADSLTHTIVIIPSLLLSIAEVSMTYPVLNVFHYSVCLPVAAVQSSVPFILPVPDYSLNSLMSI